MDNLRDHKSCKPVVLKEIRTGKLISVSNLFHFCERKKICYQGIKNLFYKIIYIMISLEKVIKIGLIIRVKIFHYYHITYLIKY